MNSKLNNTLKGALLIIALGLFTNNTPAYGIGAVINDGPVDLIGISGRISVSSPINIRQRIAIERKLVIADSIYEIPIR